MLVRSRGQHHRRSKGLAPHGLKYGNFGFELHQRFTHPLVCTGAAGGIKIDRARVRVDRHQGMRRARCLNGKNAVPLIESGLEAIGQGSEGSRLRIRRDKHLFSGIKQSQQPNDECQRVIVGQQPACFMALPQDPNPRRNQRDKFAPVHQPLPVMAHWMVFEACAVFKQGVQRRQFWKRNCHPVVVTKKRRKSHSPPNRAPISR